MSLSIKQNPGYELVIETQATVRTAAIGVWFQNGARYENDNQTGYAHLLEHLLFKGTQQHSAQDLSIRFECMGGQVNAETGRELTAVHGVVPGNNATEFLQLLLLMLTAFKFSEQEFYLERDVVLQELAMLGDDPEEALEDFSTEEVWNSHSMGRQILGTRESLAHVTYTEFKDYMREVLNSHHFTIVAIGQVNKDEIETVCQQLNNKQSRSPASSTPNYKPTSRQFEIDSQQQHLLWLMPAISYGHNNMAAYEVANHILGGGYDSRLYQILREQLGLVYSVESRCDFYSDIGLWLVQTNTDKENIEQTRQSTIDTLHQFSLSGPTATELDNAKDHLQARLILEADDISCRLESIAHELIYCGRIRSVEEQTEAYQKVQAKDVMSVLNEAWGKQSYFTAH